MLKKVKLIKPEIVAPAGKPETLSAALNAGADAVYAGVGDYNMRVNASFRPENIYEIADKVHENCSKLYLAFNVIFFDNEISEAEKILDISVKAGVDAIILWDTGILKMAKERNLNFHTSTQASVSNINAVEFYSGLGAKRIVLARELYLIQISSIISETEKRKMPVEFECFVHGAMCLAVSGRCLTSWFLTGHSANRGDCYQPCRRTYRLTDKVNGNELDVGGSTVLSAKDLSTIGILDKIIHSGINALKIEGRMRDERYVKTTVECYREARDAVIAGVYNDALVKKLEKRLESVFNRGFSTGFYLKPPDNEISFSEGNLASVEKIFAGKIVNFYNKPSAADILLQASAVKKGDTVLITGPTTGAVEFIADSIMNQSSLSVEKAEPGEIIGVKVPEKVREGDKVYVLKDKSQVNK